MHVLSLSACAITWCMVVIGIADINDQLESCIAGNSIDPRFVFIANYIHVSLIKTSDSLNLMNNS